MPQSKTYSRSDEGNAPVVVAANPATIAMARTNASHFEWELWVVMNFLFSARMTP
jgi:hypothetical protein